VNKKVHIVFGSASNAKNYSRAKAVNPRYVVNATHPELVQSKMAESVDTIVVVRYPEEVWKPITFACEKRVAEMERIIKGYQKLGVTVVEETE
jgi:hypothetical protein